MSPCNRVSNRIEIRPRKWRKFKYLHAILIKTEDTEIFFLIHMLRTREITRENQTSEEEKEEDQDQEQKQKEGEEKE